MELIIPTDLGTGIRLFALVLAALHIAYMGYERWFAPARFCACRQHVSRFELWRGGGRCQTCVKGSSQLPIWHQAADETI